MDDSSMRIAVKCKNCSFTMFYKTSMATGTVECKCPRCKSIVKVNLALRKSSIPLFFRRTTPKYWKPSAEKFILS